jgi:hypothetical protein
MPEWTDPRPDHLYRLCLSDRNGGLPDRHRNRDHGLLHEWNSILLRYGHRSEPGLLHQRLDGLLQRRLPGIEQYQCLVSEPTGSRCACVLRRRPSAGASCLHSH